jgi:PilZ domain
VEGPSLSRLPRTIFRCPVELRTSESNKRCALAIGNFNGHGMFLMAEQLPLGAPVHVTFHARHDAELDGIVRFSGGTGTGIAFATMTEAQHQALDELIAEFTPGEILSA